MLIYDVDKIENLYKDFERCQKNFKNKEYDDFSSSYFYKCSDSVIVKLRKRIQTIYDNIQKGYDMIDKVWKEYIDDVGNFDKSVASGSNNGIHDGGVSSIVSKICSIELYESAGVSTSFKSLAANGSSFLSKIGNVLKRTAATIINTTIFAVTSGAIKLIESIVDCAVLIVGAVVGLGVLLVDGAISLFSGEKRNGIETTKKYFNGLIRVVGYDVNAKIKDAFYSTKFGNWFNENSYAPFKNGGVGYKVTEVVSEIVGTIVITIFTCGGGGAAIGAAKTAGTAGTKITVGALAKVAVKGGAAAVKTAATKGIAVAVTKGTTAQLAAFAVRGASATGTNVQEGYKKLLANGAEDGNLSGKEMAKLIGGSVVKGAADGAIYSLAYGKGLGALKNTVKTKASSLASAAKSSGSSAGTALTSAKNAVKGKIDDIVTAVGDKVDEVKELKPFIKTAVRESKVGTAYNTAKTAVGSAKNAVKGKIDDIITAAGDKVDEVKELKPFIKTAVRESKVGTAYNTAKTAVGSAKSAVKGKIDDIVTAASDKVDEVKELKPFIKTAVRESKVGTAYNTAKTAVGSATKTIKTKAGNIASAVSSKANKVAETASDTKELAKMLKEPIKNSIGSAVRTGKETAKETIKIISESEKVAAVKNGTKTVINNSNKAAIIMPAVDDFIE